MSRFFIGRMILLLENMMTSFNYFETDPFKKDLKSLLKHFKTLVEDLEVAKKNAIELYHLRNIDNKSIFPIQGFCFDNLFVCKIKKFTCKAMKGKGCQSGIRVIYAFHKEKERVDFIEIYYKADQINENRERIKDYLKSVNIN